MKTHNLISMSSSPLFKAVPAHLLALLPDLAPFIRLSKNKAAVCPNDGLRGNRFQLAGEFLDATIPGIGDQMKVIRH